MRVIHYCDLTYINSTSSKGNQEKYHIDNEWIKTDYLGYEGASEFLASEILKCSNIKEFVPYRIEKAEIENRHGMLQKRNICVSKDFLLPGEEIITLEKLLRQKYGSSFEKEIQGKSIKEAISNIVNLVEKATGISDYGKHLTQMLEFDAFILNEDRHSQNIAFIYGNGVYKPCPIFDNGAAFLSDTSRDYPLDEKTNKLVSFVDAKPFSSSFEKQVRACQELYGKQLVLNLEDMSNQISVIKSYYGERISNRIQHVYDIQKFKNRNLLNIKDISSEKGTKMDFIGLSQEVAQNFLLYIENGGNVISAIIPNEFVSALKIRMSEEEIPYIVADNTKDTVQIITKDIYKRDFLQVQKDVFFNTNQKPSYSFESPNVESVLEKNDDYEK